jgi:hypothetical protein
VFKQQRLDNNCSNNNRWTTIVQTVMIGQQQFKQQWLDNNPWTVTVQTTMVGQQPLDNISSMSRQY